MTNLTTATEISSQIGAKALYMIGAKNLAATEDSLSFKVMRNAKGVTHVRISLNAMDLYNVEFLAIRGMNVRIKADFENIYNDQLNNLIENNTGLYLSL